MFSALRQLRFTSTAAAVFSLLLFPLAAFGQTPSFLLTPSYPGGSPIAAADFNGDGKLDLATLDSDSNSVTMLPGNGDGTFRQGTSFSISISSSYTILTADFNGDGKADLLIAGTPPQGVSTFGIFLGNGDGTFQSPTLISPGLALGAPVIGDVNGDGKPDLVASGVPGLFVFLGKGDGTFTQMQPVAGIGVWVLQDFNGDGKLDVAGLSGTDAYVWLGNGDGTFQTTPLISNALPMGVINVLSAAVGDFNGDGKLDIVVQSVFAPTATVNVMLGNGDGTFQAPGPQALLLGAEFSYGAGDFNGDGKSDLIVANGQTVQVFLGNADGTLNGESQLCCWGSRRWFGSKPAENGLMAELFRGWRSPGRWRCF